MHRLRSEELVKKSVGKERDVDVWDRLYRLNSFAAKLGLLRSADDGYPRTKSCWKASRKLR
jgi:hypothetical protein